MPIKVRKLLYCKCYNIMLQSR